MERWTREQRKGFGGTFFFFLVRATEQREKQQKSVTAHFRLMDAFFGVPGRPVPVSSPLPHIHLHLRASLEKWTSGIPSTT